MQRPLPFLPGTRHSDYRRSVRRLAELRFQTALPGHGLPILRDAGQRLIEYVELRYGSVLPLWWRAGRRVPLVSRLGIGVAARRLTAPGDRVDGEG